MSIFRDAVYRPSAWVTGKRPSLAPCLALALLVHLSIVLVLRNMPGGLARPAEGVWDAISIRLQGQGTVGQREAGFVAKPAAKSPIAPSASPATAPISLPSAPLVREERWVDEPRSQMSGGPSVLNAPSPSDAGRPDAGVSVGHELAIAPSLPASTPKLMLDLAPRRGGVISAQGSRGVLPLQPHPPETRPKLAEDIEKAAKPDCRQAYAGMGLLGAGALVLDLLRDQGCRW